MKQPLPPHQLLSVLLLEDSIYDYELICSNLSEAGFKMDFSRGENETDFRQLLNDKSFDLILADFKLPGFNAFEALKITMEHCPEVPFICVSGNIGEDTAIELLKQGALDYVLKDRLERLPFAIKRALDEMHEKMIRQQAEIALAESEERFRDILFSTADWIWEVDENGVYTFSSQRSEDLFDTKLEEIIGKTPFDFMPEEEVKRVAPIFGEILKKRDPIIDLENWNIGKNGRLICLLTNGVPIFDQSGNFKGYRGVDKDITGRKLAEEKIRESEANLNYAQALAKMGNWDYDVITDSYYWSKNMFELLGILPSEIPHNYQEFITLVHPDDVQLIENALNEIINEKQAVKFDFRYLLPDGKVMWVQNYIMPDFDNAQLVKLHGVNIDITENKAAEQELIKAKERAEASDRLKSAFINNISHEVRTPLNGVIGFSEMLLNPDVTSENKAIFSDIIRKSSQRLIKTITSYMDISMIVSGNMEVFNKQFAINPLLDEVYKEFQEQCESKRLELIILRPAIPADIHLNTDSDILRKIFSHLIDNAIKFTSRGSIEFGYRKHSDKLEFFVNDSGIGIDPQKVKIIFENFVQADDSITRGYEGSGLGLSIANGLTQLLDGVLTVETELHKGSTFCFSLPESIIVSTVYQEKVRRIEPLKVENPLILVAEDDEFNYKFIEIILKKADYQVLRAENGAEAVHQCKNNADINLVLMDLKMPIMGGIEATKHIKEILPDMPIIALTAYVSSTDEYEALLSGCDEFIPKPINRDKLMGLIRKLFNN
ncbi:MAG: response regulator [Bacteroidetes bacterium]|nr:response regulator [Bacteroidota bacterium]